MPELLSLMYAHAWLTMLLAHPYCDTDTCTADIYHALQGQPSTSSPSGPLCGFSGRF